MASKLGLVLTLVVVCYVLSTASGVRISVMPRAERWQSKECPYGKNFWIGCDICKCNPGGLRICASLHCTGTEECPPIPKGELWLRGACLERCACEQRTRIIHCERYCPATDGYHFYPRFEGV